MDKPTVQGSYEVELCAMMMLLLQEWVVSLHHTIRPRNPTAMSHQITEWLRRLRSG